MSQYQISVFTDGQQHHKAAVSHFGRCLSGTITQEEFSRPNERIANVSKEGLIADRRDEGCCGRSDSPRNRLHCGGCSWGSTQYTRHNSRYICCKKVRRDNCFWRLASEAYNRRRIISPRRRYATLIKCLFPVLQIIPESSVGTPEQRGPQAATSIPTLAKS